MFWYLVPTKPRHEKKAQLNLSYQGFECYLPLLLTEKIKRRELSVVEEPLFPRYLFIQLDSGLEARSWSPIRSTIGVSRLVRFGLEPAKVNERLIAILKNNEKRFLEAPQELFTEGEKLQITDGPFAGIEAIYQMKDGQARALVLIEFMGRSVKVPLSPTQLKKVS